MSDRRFTDKPDLAPWSVRGLAEDHPAMLQDRTLFPSTVVEVTADAPDRLLVSGANNRKLGATVEKGAFKGYGLYGLSLEERATCPTDCAVRDVCYGNGMQMARRHRIGDPDVFYDRLATELADLCIALEDTGGGVLVRLHVLGDFPSVEYVGFWGDALDEHPNLAVYGYTARRSTSWGGDEIGDAIQSLKDRYPDRFRIRWSSTVSRPDGTMVIGNVPKSARIDEGIVCPSQTDATACCATCALCWEPAAAKDSIVFIKHGPKSDAVAAEAAMDTGQDDKPGAEDNTRPVAPLQLAASVKPAPITHSTPEVRMVSPADLRIEAAYQRDLSGRSVTLIRKIVTTWDWTKFKPPVCAETPDGLFVIDGQHTAIAAASHPGIVKIPVLIVQAKAVETRARAFVSHNRDRLAMSPLQIFHADAAAGDPATRTLLAIAERVGASIPRAAPARGRGKPGQMIAVTDLKATLTAHGEAVVERIMRIAVMAQRAPLTRLETRALRMLLTAGHFAAARTWPDSRIANAMKGLPELESDARAVASDSGQGADRAAAVLICVKAEEAAQAA